MDAFTKAVQGRRDEIMRELLKLIELADKYNFEITVKPSRNIWNVVVRRFFVVNGVEDFYARHMVFHSEDIEDLNVSFETVLAEVDKDFYIEMEEEIKNDKKTEENKYREANEAIEENAVQEGESK